MTLHFLHLEKLPYDDTQSRTDIKTRENCRKELYNIWIHFSPTCRQNLNISAVITIYCQQNSIFLKQKNIQNSIHYLTGQNRCLSGLKNHDRQPAVRYFQPCREQYARSNGATARLLTLVKPAETLARKLTKHKQATRNGDVTEHHLQMKHQIDWDSVTCIMYFDLQTTINDSL